MDPRAPFGSYGVLVAQARFNLALDNPVAELRRAQAQAGIGLSALAEPFHEQHDIAPHERELAPVPDDRRAIAFGEPQHRERRAVAPIQAPINAPCRRYELGRE